MKFTSFLGLAAIASTTLAADAVNAPGLAIRDDSVCTSIITTTGLNPSATACSCGDAPGDNPWSSVSLSFQQAIDNLLDAVQKNNINPGIARFLTFIIYEIINKVLNDLKGANCIHGDIAGFLLEVLGEFVDAIEKVAEKLASGGPFGFVLGPVVTALVTMFNSLVVTFSSILAKSSGCYNCADIDNINNAINSVNNICSKLPVPIQVPLFTPCTNDPVTLTSVGPCSVSSFWTQPPAW